MENKNKKKHTEKDLKRALGYGLGYICGKHNVSLTKKEIKRIWKNYKTDLTNPEIKKLLLTIF